MNHTGLFALLSYIGSESHELTQSFLMNVTEEAKLWSKLEDWWVQRRGDCGALLAMFEPRRHKDAEVHEDSPTLKLRRTRRKRVAALRLQCLNHEDPKAGRNKKKRLRSIACKWMKQADCFINVHEHYCQKSTFV